MLVHSSLRCFICPLTVWLLYTLPLHRGFALIGIYSLKGSLLCLSVYIYMIWQWWMIIPNVAKDSNDDLGGCRSHQYEKYELFLLLLIFTLRSVWCQWEWLCLIWSSYSCPAHLLFKPKCSLKTSHFRQSMEGTPRVKGLFWIVSCKATVVDCENTSMDLDVNEF